MQLQITKHKLIIRSLLDLWFRQNTIFIASSSGTAVDERIVCDAFTNCHWNLFFMLRHRTHHISRYWPQF